MSQTEGAVSIAEGMTETQIIEPAKQKTQSLSYRSLAGATDSRSNPKTAGPLPPSRHCEIRHQV